MQTSLNIVPKEQRHYRYRALMEYLPVRYSATEEQEKVRQMIYSFKDGFCNSTVKNMVVEALNSLSTSDKSNLVIAFIPASSNVKTFIRYRDLSEAIQDCTGIKSSYLAITNIRDHQSGHLYGKKSNPAEDFQVDESFVAGKEVILIDDIITRGNTFVSTADKVYDCGAKEVYGLFLARTINPDRQ